MIKISKRVSTTISLALVVIVFILLVLALFIAPDIWIMYYHKLYMGDTSTQIDHSLLLSSMIVVYLSLLPAFVADISLFILLKNIRIERCFEKINVRMLRIISWCCFFECIIFFVLWAMHFYMFWALSFAAAFIGVILRVVKNVMEEATEIKSENDLTV